MTQALVMDVDGVVLEWEQPFIEFLDTKGIRGDDDTSQYKFNKRYNMTYKEMSALVGEFNSSEATRTLKPFRDSVVHIQKLHEMGYHLIAVTHMGTCPIAYENRLYNLSKVFGKGVFKELYCISQSVSKSIKLAELAIRFPGVGWIEDHPDNAKLGAALGYQAFLMDHPHNQGYPDLNRIASWKEFMEKYHG